MVLLYPLLGLSTKERSLLGEYVNRDLRKVSAIRTVRYIEILYDSLTNFICSQEKHPLYGEIFFFLLAPI